MPHEIESQKILEEYPNQPKPFSNSNKYPAQPSDPSKLRE